MSEQSYQATPDEVTTSSRLWAWYLVQFRGYTVAQCREVPRITRLGRLTYECRWLLRVASTVSN